MIGLVSRAFRRSADIHTEDPLGGGVPKSTRPRAFPLALAQEGEHVRISGVKAGKGLNHRLRELGLPVGTDVTIRQRNSSGGMVVARDSLRIALGAGLAHKVVVTLMDTPKDTLA